MKALVLAFVLVSSPALAQNFPNYQDQVQRAINELHLSWDQCRVNGVEVNDGPLLEERCHDLVVLDDQMKGTVFLRAAYYINQLNPNLGLLVKTSGANIKGFSTDLLVERGTGWFVDTLTTGCCDEHGQRFALARWGVGPPDANTSDPSRWFKPTAELAGLTNQPPPIVVPPTPPPVVTPVPVLTDDDVTERAILQLLQDHDRRAEEHWKEAKSAWESVKPFFVFVSKYILPAVGGWVIGKNVADQ